MTILVVDDHEEVRRGICYLLSAQSEWSICGEAADGLEAVAKARLLKPDIVLMDISMPRMDRLDATRLIRKELPETRVLIVSQNDPEVVRYQAEQADASGYVVKADIPRELITILQRFRA